MSLVRTRVPMAGGMNTSTPRLLTPMGQSWFSVNYEALPLGGYRRIYGYELYDGAETAAAVPGEGQIRGVFVLGGTLYAIRDQASAGGLYKESAAGWTAVSLGTQLLFDAGSTEIVAGNTITGGTSGATATVDRVMVASGLWASSNATGLLVVSSVSGTFQDGEDLEVSAAKVAEANGTTSDIELPKGGRYDFIVRNFFGDTGSVAVYGANGVGSAFEFDGTTFAPIVTSTSDYPTHVGEINNHLVLGYSQGYIHVSVAANPRSFSVGLDAAEIAVGDEVVDMGTAVGGTLIIGCRNTTHLMSGLDTTDFRIEKMEEFGTRGRTLGSVYSRNYVLTDQGVQEIVPVQEFGDFTSSAVSQLIDTDVRRDLNDMSDTDDVVAASFKKNSQYRVFFGRRGYYFTHNGPNLVGVMPVLYADPVHCMVTAAGSDGREVAYFGSDDGEVFKMDTGGSFDGDQIRSEIQLPFSMDNAGQHRKRFKRFIFGMDVVGDQPDLYIRAIFTPTDYAQFGANSSLIDMNEAGRYGTDWDVPEWDTVEWGEDGIEGTASARVGGVGQRCMVTLFNDGAKTNSIYTLSSVVILWEPRRLRRGA